MNKQVEEMAKDIYESKSCDTSFEENCKLLAYDLVALGYQKVDTNRVVLSREEYNRLLACEHNLNVGRESYRRMEERAYKTIEELNQELAQERKETAREILERGKYCMPSGLREWIKKQYDV